MTLPESVRQIRFLIQAVAILACCVSSTYAQNDFSITASPNSQTVWQGNSSSYVLTITVTSSFSGDIALTATGMPTGMTAETARSQSKAQGRATEPSQTNLITRTRV